MANVYSQKLTFFLALVWVGIVQYARYVMTVGRCPASITEISSHCSFITYSHIRLEKFGYILKLVLWINFHINNFNLSSFS